MDPVSAPALGRRRFLGGTAALLGGLATPGLLASCAKSTESSGAASPGSGPVPATFQLSWITNIQFAGEYVALAKGFYKQEGIDPIDVLNGGPDVAPDPVVQGGKAILGISSPELTSAAVNEGASLKVIGTIYQKNPFAVMSLAKTPIRSPEELYGRKIGVQAVNMGIWNAFVKLAGLDASRIDVVPSQFDPSPLVAGQVDAWLSFFFDEPNDLRGKGIDVEVFKLADHNFTLFNNVYIAREDSLKSQRETLRRLMRAEVRGWQEALADKDESVRLTLERGKNEGLDPKVQPLKWTSQRELILTDDSRAHGLLTMSDTAIEGNLETLAAAGINATKDLFDTSLMTEVFDGKTSL